MVIVEYFDSFCKSVKKFKGDAYSTKIKKQILRIIENPTIGKPMRFSRKGSREVYVGSYRISYVFYEQEQKILFLDVYHKDDQ
jgi:mRNA-degrading endonuclease RelE of RelBE toxin-antitoxin system